MQQKSVKILQANGKNDGGEICDLTVQKILVTDRLCDLKGYWHSSMQLHCYTPKHNEESPLRNELVMLVI